MKDQAWGENDEVVSDVPWGQGDEVVAVEEPWGQNDEVVSEGPGRVSDLARRAGQSAAEGTIAIPEAAYNMAQAAVAPGPVINPSIDAPLYDRAVVAGQMLDSMDPYALDAAEKRIAQRDAAKTDTARLFREELSTSIDRPLKWLRELKAEQRDVYGANEKYDNRLLSAVASGAGSSVPAIVLAVASGGSALPAYATTGLQLYQESFDEAIRNGGSRQQANAAGLAAMPLAYFEKFGDVRIGKRLREAADTAFKAGERVGWDELAKRTSSEWIQSSVGEGATEAVQQAGQDTIQTGMGLQRQSAGEFLTRAGYSGLVGAATGGVLGAPRAGLDVAGNLSRGRRTEGGGQKAEDRGPKVMPIEEDEFGPGTDQLSSASRTGINAQDSTLNGENNDIEYSAMDQAGGDVQEEFGQDDEVVEESGLNAQLSTPETATWTAATPNENLQVGGAWDVVEAGDLVTSFDAGYDQSLQPRDRQRQASGNQVAGIVRRFEPQRLGDSTTTDMGSPIVDELNQVISGNGRVTALRELYGAQDVEQVGEMVQGRNEDYRQFVIQQADRLGMPVGRLAGMRQPVLVRRVADYGGMSKAELARQSNEQQVLGMSEAEKTTADAMLLRGNERLLRLFAPSEDGDLLAESNRDFLNGFIEATGDQAALLGKDGYNAGTLRRRVQNAVLGALLGPESKQLLGDLVEGAEELGVKRQVAGIMAAAPRLLEFTGGTYDLGPVMQQALTDFIGTKRRKETVQEFLGQANLIADPRRTAESDLMLEWLSRQGSAKQVTEGMERYRKAARNARADEQSGGLFGDKPLTRYEIVKQVTRTGTGSSGTSATGGGGTDTAGNAREADIAMGEPAAVQAVSGGQADGGDVGGDGGLVYTPKEPSFCIASIGKGGMPKGINRNWAQIEAESVRRLIPGAPEIIVVQKADELPQYHRDYVKRELSNGFLVKGFYADGIAYIIADHFNSNEDFRPAILEESIGHPGMHALLKDRDYDELYKLIKAHRPKEFKQISRNYRINEKILKQRRLLVSEYVAKESRWVGTKEMDRFWRRVVDVVLRALYRAGLLPNRYGGNVLDARMRALARKAIGQLSAKRPVDRSSLQSFDGIAYSQEKLNTEDDVKQDPVSGPTYGQRRFVRQAATAPNLDDAVRTRVSNVFYQVRRNQETAARAARLVDDLGGPRMAMEVFRDKVNGLDGATRSFLGQMIVVRMSQMARDARKAGDGATTEALAKASAQFFNDELLPATTEAAQFLQALSAFQGLTPEGMIESAKRQVDGARDKAMGSMKPTLDAAEAGLKGINAEVADTVTRTAEAQAAARDAVDAAARMEPAVWDAIRLEATNSPAMLEVMRAKERELRSRWMKDLGKDSYWGGILRAGQDKLLRQIEGALRGVGAGGKAQAATVQRLADDLVKVLREQVGLETGGDSQAQRNPRENFTRLRQLLSNAERMSEVWARVRERLAQDYGADPRVVAILGREMQVWGPGLLGAVMREELKQAGISFQDVVKGHYEQSAGPGLAAKIIAELGLDAQTGEGLARDLDAAWRAEVDQVRRGLKGRMARARKDPRFAKMLKAGLATPEDVPAGELDAALMVAMRDARMRLGDVVRKHWREADAQGRGLAERIAQDAGVPKDMAERLANVLQRRFNALATEKKQQLLERLAAPWVARKVLRRGLAEKMIEMTNLGAWRSEKLWNEIAKKLDIPAWTEDLAREVGRRVEGIHDIPEDQTARRQKATIELMNRLAQDQIGALDMTLAMYLANILTGVTTHALNVISNFENLTTQTAVEVMRAAAGGRLADIPLMIEAALHGSRKGLSEGREVLKTGITTGSRLQKSEAGNTLEVMRRDGWWRKILAAWRYNYRLMAAEDLFFFKSGEELKAAIMAKAIAKEMGLNGDAATAKAREILGYGASARAQAESKAAAEGFKGPEMRKRAAEILEQQRPEEMRETARDYGLRVSFNNRPYGALGKVAGAINQLKSSDNAKVRVAAMVTVPFVNIVCNVVNESLNYSPVGLSRSAWAKYYGQVYGQSLGEDLTPGQLKDAAADVFVKGFLGTSMLAAMALAAATGLDDEDPELAIYGAGPSSPDARKGWMAAGNVPYSIKVGKQRFVYSQNPAAIALGALGRYHDGIRYEKLEQQDLLNRAVYAALGAGSQVTQMSFLQGIGDAFKLMSESHPRAAGESGLKLVTRTATSVAVPNLLRQLDKLGDPTVYDARGAEANLVAQLPYARRMNRPAINALGDVVNSPLSRRFLSQTTDDPVVKLLADKGAWLSLPDRARVYTRTQRSMTDDEYYEYVRGSGSRIKGWVASRQGFLQGRTPDQVKALVSDAAERIRQQERRRLGF